MSVNDATRIVIYHQKSLKSILAICSAECCSAKCHSGPNISKLFTTIIYTNVSNKPECLSLASLSSLALFLQVRLAEAYQSEAHFRHPPPLRVGSRPFP
jgi:hypothetical protein